LRGSTNIHELHKVGVHIWDNDCPNMETGELGPIYGHQWRQWNGNVECDQIQQIIDALRSATDPTKPVSRRIILSAWNPEQLPEMALPPCHILAQFYVKQNRYLSCALYQRSADIGLGVPFNILSYSFLTHLLAHHCGLVAEEFVHFLGSTHIYEEHVPALKTQIVREPKPFPKIRFNVKREKIEDYVAEDIEWITPYEHADFIKMQIR
jgi:thymidylate synthase